jgi:hypothetical protein
LQTIISSGDNKATASPAFFTMRLKMKYDKKANAQITMKGTAICVGGIKPAN